MRKKHIAIFIACCLLITVAVYQKITHKQDVLATLQKAEPAAVDFEEIGGTFPVYQLLDKNGRLLGYAVISSASGYGGPITVLTTINKNGIVEKAMILDHAETPAYMERVLEAGYPENLRGIEVTDSAREYAKLDAVGGATRTTEGILAAVEKGMAFVGENQLGVDVPPVEFYQFQWEEGAVVLLLFIAVLAAAFKFRKIRPVLLVASIIVIGFAAKFSLTLGHFVSVISDKMPAFIDRPVWYVFIFGILVFTLLLGKNFYCGWLCPFGAAQEGIFKALNLKKVGLDRRLEEFAGKSKWFFIWLAALFALFFNNPGIASFEPFAVLFGGEGPVSQWLIMGLILFMSIFILRFWCRCFCPVGALLNVMSHMKRRFHRFLRKHRMQETPGVQKNVQPCAKSTCGSCQTGQSRDKIKRAPLSAFNKAVLVMIAVIDLLIIGVLLQNSGIFS